MPDIELNQIQRDLASLDQLTLEYDSDLDWILSSRDYFVASFMHEKDAKAVMAALNYIQRVGK